MGCAPSLVWVPGDAAALWAPLIHLQHLETKLNPQGTPNPKRWAGSQASPEDEPETGSLCSPSDGHSPTRSRGKLGPRPQRELSKLFWALGPGQRLRGRSLGQNKISFLQGSGWGRATVWVIAWGWGSERNSEKIAALIQSLIQCLALKAPPHLTVVL